MIYKDYKAILKLYKLSNIFRKITSITIYEIIIFSITALAKNEYKWYFWCILLMYVIIFSKMPVLIAVSNLLTLSVRIDWIQIYCSRTESSDLYLYLCSHFVPCKELFCHNHPYNWFSRILTNLSFNNLIEE